MVIVATSDQHLGSDTSNQSSFEEFLDQIIRTDTTITDFVLLGDVVDMWRRDASGVFLENRKIFENILSLPKNIKVHYVYGNHDYHLRYLKDHAYPFKFVDELPLTEDGRNYRFVHGCQFDDLMKKAKPLLDPLCRVMSDDMGNYESALWAMLTRDPSDREYFSYPISEKREILEKVKELLQKPEVRLAGRTLDAIEKEACNCVDPDEILVFGHTHVPFINESGTVVNTGCWVKDAPVHNTYVRLDADGPRLFEFGKGEITEKVRR